MKIKSHLSKLKRLPRVLSARLFGVSPSIHFNKNESSDTRIMYVSNAFIPTLQLSFIKPLEPLVQSGQIASDILTEQQMKELFGKNLKHEKVCKWIVNRIKEFNPTVIVFCRYSGPNVECIIDLSKKLGVPTVFHIDDDLLNVPIEIGVKKFEYHNSPVRLASVKYLLNEVDLVYFSTTPLMQRFQNLGYSNENFVGDIYCSGEILVHAIDRPVKKIGYMGFDHAHDFELVLPAIIRILQRYPHIEFELFGSIPKPLSLNEFGNRVNVIAPIPNYAEFMTKFSTLNWDIGLCPLAKTAFNEVKANTKWVEYTSIGAVVVATNDSVYNDCCADNCGQLVLNSDQWFDDLDLLVSNSGYRFQLVTNAQTKLEKEYSLPRLRSQVLDVLNKANEVKRKK